MDEIERSAVQLQNGDIDGLKNLYELTKRNAFNLAFVILRNYFRAEDIMQDAFIIVKNKIGQYKAGTNFKAWLATITRNLAYKELEKQKKLSPLDVAENIAADQKAEDYIESSTVLKAALKHLNDKEREVVSLYAIGGFKHREIAKIMNMPLGTVTWLYNKAIKKLREVLEEDGL